MPPAGFEPATPASDRPQTLALHRSATGTCDSVAQCVNQLRHLFLRINCDCFPKHLCNRKTVSFSVLW